MLKWPTEARNPVGVSIDYTNHQGTRDIRHIVPQRLVWTKNKYHPEAQWHVVAIDTATSAVRSFPMASIHNWDGPPPPAQELLLEQGQNTRQG